MNSGVHLFADSCCSVRRNVLACDDACIQVLTPSCSVSNQESSGTGPAAWMRILWVRTLDGRISFCDSG